MNKMLILSFALFAPHLFAQSAAFDCSAEMSELECKIYQETNLVRETHGEAKLLISPECTQAAIYHAESMEESGVYGHEIKGYKSFPERMNSFRVRGSRMAENIHHRALAHFSTLDEAAREIVSDWYESKGHRKNMMNKNFKAIGVAVVGDYQVQCFTDYADSSPKEQVPAQTESKSEGSLKDIFKKIKIPNPFKR